MHYSIYMIVYIYIIIIIIYTSIIKISKENDTKLGLLVEKVYKHGIKLHFTKGT